MKIEDLRKKKEALEAELTKIREQEKAEAEKKLKDHAQALLKELKAIDYTAWALDADDGFFIRIGKKRVSASSNEGHEITVVAPDGKSHDFNSGAEACRHLGLSFEGNSAVRVLKSKGYKVEKS